MRNFDLMDGSRPHVAQYLDCGCAIYSNGERTLCPTCGATDGRRPPLLVPGERLSAVALAALRDLAEAQRQEVARLRTENERLRTALEGLVGGTRHAHWIGGLRELDQARAALEGQP